MNSFMSTMSEQELQELNLPSVVNAGNFDQANPNLLGVMGSPLPQTDKEGRQIVSYDQYKELQRLGARLDNYSVRMIWPGKNSINTIQASKFQKWYGLGYRPLGELDAMVQRRKAAAPAMPESGLPEDVTLFFCREKYQDCDRVFDREKGLKFHWNNDHGEAPIRRRAPKASIT